MPNKTINRTPQSVVRFAHNTTLSSARLLWRYNLFKSDFMKIIFSMCLAILISSCASQKVSQTESVYEELDLHGVKTISLLNNEEYDGLISLYKSLGKSYLNSVKYENALFIEIDSLAQTELDLKEKLDDFVSYSPNSYIPYYLRATYLSSKAWNKRGSNFIDETTQEQIDGFIYFKKIALKDIEKAILLDGELSWLYLQKRLILIGERGKEYEKEKAFDNAFNLRPESYMLWNDLLHNSTPRWGGSIEGMKSIIEKSKKFWPLNPRLQELPASIYRELGDQARFSKKYHEAENLYLKSLEIGDHPWTRFELGRILMERGDYKNGCKNIFKSLDLRPTLKFSNEKAAVCKTKGYRRDKL